MKRFTHPFITISLSLLLALCCAALTYSTPSETRRDFTTGASFKQVTPPPQLQGKSVVGSTDQIVIMAGVISFIIIVPMLMSRRSWR